MKMLKVDRPGDGAMSVFGIRSNARRLSPQRLELPQHPLQDTVRHVLRKPIGNSPIRVLYDLRRLYEQFLDDAFSCPGAQMYPLGHGGLV